MWKFENIKSFRNDYDTQRDHETKEDETPWTHKLFKWILFYSHSKWCSNRFHHPFFFYLIPPLSLLLRCLLLFWAWFVHEMPLCIKANYHQIIPFPYHSTRFRFEIWIKVVSGGTDRQTDRPPGKQPYCSLPVNIYDNLRKFSTTRMIFIILY